jgi:CubicO group peptidase (beta-lactamase class C family)
VQVNVFLTEFFKKLNCLETKKDDQMKRAIQNSIAAAIVALVGLWSTSSIIAVVQETQPVTHSGNAQTLEQTEPQGKGARQTAPAARSQAVYPSVEIVKYDEQLNSKQQFAKAVITLRFRNKGTTDTDPFSFTIKDGNKLLRQAKPLSIPALKPGAVQLRDLDLEADLSGPQEQNLEPTKAWHERYRASCGPQFVSAFDWQRFQEHVPEHAPAPVPSTQVPRNGHFESALHLEAVSDVHFSADPNPNPTICDGAHCVKPCEMAKEIQRQLDGHVVGYSFFVGLNSKFGAYGPARTSADGTERSFTSKTKISVASVSKLVTTIAAVRILDRNNVGLDDTIGRYFPSDWSVSTYVSNLTFAQLLSHTSGIKDYGNVNTDYATLKQFFTQSVSNNSSTTCTESPNDHPSNPINPNNHGRCYSNYNFAIFRILLPKVAGRAEESNLTNRPGVLADQYQELVRQNVFDLVGQTGVMCKPPAQNPGASNFAFAYQFPGSTPGYNWGDESLKCGAAGWYLSVEDIAQVLLSINAGDGRILVENATKRQFEDMRTRHLGWDTDLDTELEKNGGYGYGTCDSPYNCKVISTSVAVFGPVTGPRLVAVLFMNSNISGGPRNAGGAKGVLEHAYQNSLRPK